MRIGMSSVAYEFTDESFSEMIKNGITDMELSRSIEEHAVTDYTAVKKMADKHGVNLWSYHLPFGGPDNLEICSPREDVRADSIRIWTECVKMGSEVGIDKFIAHPSSDAP